MISNAEAAVKQDKAKTAKAAKALMLFNMVLEHLHSNWAQLQSSEVPLRLLHKIMMQQGYAVDTNGDGVPDTMVQGQPM